MAPFKKGSFMIFRRNRIVFSMVVCAFACCIFSAQSQTLKRKALFNLDWKFYKGTPSGSPQSTSFNDASWQSVSVPHSASYDSIVYSAEKNYYEGDCWYRKTFSVPASAGKVFMEFEGAMQTSTVWLNGTQVAVHDNSGYTPFYCDVSGAVARGGGNVVAVKLNNVRSTGIPPGDVGSSPDFHLYGGLYRSVWLHFKDSVYIPMYTQHIQTEKVSAASAVIHALTAVKNASASSKAVTVTITLLDAARASVASQTATLTLPAGALDTFDISTAAISGPHLWSPSSPYLYTVKTLVGVNNQTVDSVLEPCGIRWFSWNPPSQGFFLNGSRLEIRGMCLHQFEGWIGNAVPDSRYYQEIKMLKNMGCNSVRCAHYPRAQAFYDACDKLGMLLYVEQPSWGWGATPTAECWTRMDSCTKEMVLAGRNHPSIYLWGLYNEPVPNPYVSFASNITTLNNRVKSLDTTRPTATANIYTTSYGNPGWNPSIDIPDIIGLNYTISYNANMTKPWINTESRNGFYFASARGSILDLDTTGVDTDNGNAADEWNEMAFTLNTSGQLAGGHFWCFKDYNSWANTNGYEGVVDRLTVPKTVFYMYRQKWTGQAPDYPRPGTATKIDLQSDTNSLYATGSDIFLLTATLRDGANHQISSDSGNVAFTVNPSTAATIFGGNNVKAYGGRAGAFLRTTVTPAAVITVTATYPPRSSIPSASLTLTTLAASESYTDGTVGFKPALRAGARDGIMKLRAIATAQGFIFQCPPEKGSLSVFDCQGRTVFFASSASGGDMRVGRCVLGTGLYWGRWENGRQSLLTRIHSVK